MTARAIWIAIALLVCLTRICHIDLVWVEEAYPLAAAAELLRGKALYRDIWFDKPPFYALIYTLWGAQPGWLLRLSGAAFILLCCVSVWRFARDAWGEVEGLSAAALLAFFLTFGIPSAVMALAPDLLMLPLHVLAVYAAWRSKPLLAGSLAGLAMLVNSKAVFVAAACLLWPGRLHFLSSFALTQFIAALILPAEYWMQVWAWGYRYSADTSANWAEGVRRTANWAGFHAAVVTAALWYLWRDRNCRIGLWLAVSCLAVFAGWRFFPRYYFHLLPVVTLCAARGFSLLGHRSRAAVLCLLLIPLVRFGPRYIKLATGNREWSDLALMQDSRDAAKFLNRGDVLVWGYRPELFVFARRQAGTKFLDSQPLTGVLADRHLVESRPTLPDVAAANRKDLVAQRPTYIVDGLGPLNPQLAIHQFPDLQTWLANYAEIGRTRHSIVYRLK